jgi:hypothetical protein
MTSAWKEPPDGDDHTEGQSVEPDENQLEMFETAPRERTDARLPRMADLTDGSNGRKRGESQRTEVMVSDVSSLRFLGASGADPEELRRLEDSIRWLMNESTVRHHLPRAATLPPVRGLPPVEVDESDDSLLLNPERLFPPRASRRSSVVRGAAKFLLASAVAAPTAYFVASGLQRAEMTAPTEPSATATITGTFEERVAAAASAPKRSAPERARIGDEVIGTSQPEPIATRAISPAEALAAIPMEVKSPAADTNTVEAAAAPQPLPAVTTAPPDPVRNAIAPSSPPANTAPAKPALSAEEIAALVERGRVLFDAGDLAAARLFFRRAANAGDAAAALAMGATYDPDVLSKRFIRGIGADLNEAREWYEKARELGSPEGPRRLETLLAHR